MTILNKLRRARTRLRRAFRRAVGRADLGPPVVDNPATMIDVRDLIARSSIEELNRGAEAYFAKLENWDYYLAKPLVNPREAPALLINFGTVLQTLDVSAGMRVLDFGAGTGWTSRMLTQLGCEVILLDVSPSALRIAEEVYRMHPPVGNPPPPRMLTFDGRRIDLPDGSVDRILCFDAFHHVVNPSEMIAEFSRVLAPAGLAAFNEPGPHHSKEPTSQMEMRNHAVIENDVDIDAIWRAAQQAGFVSIRLSAFNVSPIHIDLEQYYDLLEGGATRRHFARVASEYMRNARNFSLRKGGEVVLDSRGRTGMACRISVQLPPAAQAGEWIQGRARVVNSGKALWLPSGPDAAAVSLGCHLYDAAGIKLAHDHHWVALSDPPRPIHAGEAVEVELKLPPLAAGRYELEFDCVSQRIAWFEELGSKPVRVSIDVL